MRYGNKKVPLVAAWGNEVHAAAPMSAGQASEEAVCRCRKYPDSARVLGVDAMSNVVSTDTHGRSRNNDIVIAKECGQAHRQSKVISKD